MMYTIIHEYIEGRLIDDFGLNFSTFNAVNDYKTYNFGAHTLASFKMKSSIDFEDLRMYFLDELQRTRRIKIPIIELNNITTQTIDEIVELHNEMYQLNK